MDKRLSTKLSILSFALLLFVVVNHGVNVKFAQSGDGLTVWFLENLISYKLSKVMIPTFFFISGYLFFLSFDASKPFAFGSFSEKITKRLRTLGIPYLFWCTFWFGFWCVLQVLPGVSHLFGTPLHEMPIWKQFWTLYLEPINYPFWFIRELLLYVFVTPLLYLFVKYLKIPGLLILYVAAGFWFSAFNVWDVDIYRFHMMFWYCFGIYCAINKVNMRLNLEIGWQLLLAAVGVGLCIYIQSAEINVPQFENLWYNRFLNNITALIGCVSIWSLYDYFDDRMHFKRHNLFAFGFIVYACHGIPILLLKEMVAKVLNPSPWISFALYFATIAVVIVGCIGFGMLFRKLSPKFYALVTGNR